MDCERKLIKACLKRDRVAQRALVDRYGPALIAVCRRYAPKGMDPRDLLQEAFIKIFKSLARIDFEKGSPKSYMKRICIHLAYDYQLKLKRTTYRNDPVDETFDVSFDPTIIEDLEVEYLMELVDELPAVMKSVFNLYVIDGYRHAEIAEVLSISESSSRSNLSRARVRLQKKILKNEQRYRSNKAL